KTTAKEDEDAKKKEQEERQRQAEARRRAEAEARFAEAMKPVEALVARWDFAAALEALSKLLPPTPNTEHLTPFSSRLATRRDELERLGKLKLKMIERINTATPKLRKGSLLIPGINADLVKADDKAITAQFETGKTESHEWPELSARSVQRLLSLTVDSDSADDHLAAGIFLLSVGGASLPRDPAAAEAFFHKAKALGAAIDRYLDPLAAAAFASANALLDKKDFSAAESALAAIEKKYEKSPWLAAHKDDVAAALAAAKAGIAESEAEKLYAEAVKLFEKKELFDLKPLIEKLKTDYPKTRPVTDATRKPAFAEMLKATETLGKFLTVRQDGKGDFKTIQAAIDAAPPNSLIEIQDSATYAGVRIAKQGLTLRGGNACWPVLDLAFEKIGPIPVTAAARDVSVGHLIARYSQGHGSKPLGRGALAGAAGSFRMYSLIAYAAGSFFSLETVEGVECTVEDSVLVGIVSLRGPTEIRDSLCLQMMVEASARARLDNIVAPSVQASAPCEMRFCTVTGSAQFAQEPNVLLNSITGRVDSVREGTRVDWCDVYHGKSGYKSLAKPGRSCFSADPQFRDPANFDYRLKPTSPCRGKASDGGDIGCRYTPEMIEVLEKALELRKKGIIKF
ncbi:MAG TPA: hypothetical protein VNE39_23825, partial [Planctomycetota bacterium]|nr:hypothetical protein [Planctomycetota bacterium]